jgi:hypothetical protein
MNKRHKKKKAHFSGRRVGATRRGMPRNQLVARSGKGQTDFSMKNKEPRFPLPKPIELAKLAAILRRDPYSKPASALKVAMEFYVEAVRFCGECASMSSEDLIAKFGSEERLLKLTGERIKKVVQPRWEDTLELDPEKHTDPARDFLADRGVHLKTPRAVLTHIRDVWNARPKDTIAAKHTGGADAVITRCKTVLDGKTIYKIPKFLFEAVVEHEKQHRRKYKREWSRARHS